MIKIITNIKMHKTCIHKFIMYLGTMYKQVPMIMSPVRVL